MTSLAKQLQQLAIPGQPSLRQVVSKKRPSLLFGAKEAADIDVATIHALGCNGLEELIAIDAGFAAFEAQLFHESLQSFERTVQTAAVLKVLDDTLGAFLLKLSPYFLLRAAQKCLEWLIRAFRVTSFNVDAVMECILPYHETKLFARVLQLLPLKDPSSRWHWLRPSQRAGSPLSRLTLVQHCLHTPSFLAHLCEMVPRSIEANRGSTPAVLRGVLALYVSTLVGVLKQVRKVSEELLTLVLPHIMAGLKSDLTDYRAATYVIIGQLVTVATLGDRLNTSLLETISKHLDSSSGREGLACLAVLCQTQQVAVFSRKTVKHLLRWPSLVAELTELSLSCSLEALLRPLLEGLVARHLHGNATPQLHELLDEIKLDDRTALHLAKDFLKQFLALREDKAEEKAISLAAGIMQALDVRYPSALDRAMAEQPWGAEGAGRWVDALVSSSLSASSRHKLLKGGASLAVSVHHGNPAVRSAAVRQLGRVLAGGDRGAGQGEGFAGHALLARVCDDEPSVVAAVLAIDPQVLFASAAPELMVKALLQLLAKPHLHRPSSPWQQCALKAVNVVTSQALLDHAPSLADDVILTVIPLLFAYRRGNNFAGKVAEIISASAMATTHPLLIGIQDIFSLPVWLSACGEGPADISSLCQASEVALVHFGRQLGGGAIAMETALQLFERLVSVLKETTQKHVQFSLATVAGVAIETAPLSPQLQFVHSIFGPILELADHMTCPSLEGVTGLPETLSDVFPFVIMKHPQLARAQVLLLLWLLKTIVASLKAPQELSTFMWLRVPPAGGGRGAGLEGSYHSALLRLLTLLTRCIDTVAMETGVPAACKELLRWLFQGHLRGRGVLLRFLAMVWTAPPGCHGNVSPALQARCLSIAAAYISSLDSASALMLTGPCCPVVLSLLPPLMSSHEAVRSSALKCLAALHSRSSAPSSDEAPPTDHAPLLQLVDTLCSSHLELLSDPATLPRLLATMMSYPATPPQGRGRKRKRRGSSSWPHPQAVLECLVSHVTATDMPSHTQCSILEALAEVQHLGKLCVPAVDRLLAGQTGSRRVEEEEEEEQGRILQMMVRCYGDSVAQFLQPESEQFQLLIRLLGATQSPSKTTPTPQEMAVEQITPAFFEGLPPGAQGTLLWQLIDKTLDPKSSALCLKACIRKLPLTADLVAAELGRHANQPGVATATPSKRQRRSKVVATALGSWTEEEGIPFPWKRVTLTLELTQQVIETLCDHTHLLLPVLFSLLNSVLELPEVCRQQLEYTQQLILSQLLTLTAHAKRGGADGRGFNVEMIVQCIRASGNPQTHRHALLLLSAAAAVYPDRVLHNVMPVFTFMGSHVMRHDDQYSFQVIAKTIDSVIPALIQSDAAVLPVARGRRTVNRKSSVVSVVTEIVRVFVDAGPHVPEHRRLPLFSRLLSTLGAGQYLHVAMAMIIGQQITEESVKDQGSKSVPCLGSSFLVSLFRSFPLLTQLEAVLGLVTLLPQLPLEKPATTAKLRQVPAEISAVFNVAAHSGKQLHQFKLTTLSLLSSLLSHHTLTAQARAVGGDDLVALETTVLSILQQLLGFTAALRRTENSASDKVVDALSRRAFKTLSQVVALMSPASFVEVITQLIGQRGHVTDHVTGETQRKAIEMLSAKLEEPKSSFTKENDSALLQLLEVLVGVAKESHAHPSTRHSALCAVKQLAAHFEGRHEVLFVQVLEDVIAMATVEGVASLVLSGSLLCLATLCRVLGPHSIPILPSLLPLTLACVTENSSDQLLLAATTTLTVVVETLPKFLSSYAVDIVTRTCGTALVGVAETSPLCKQAAQLRKSIATQLPARVLLPALQQSYTEIEQCGKRPLLALLGVAEAAVASLEGDEVRSHAHTLQQLFTAALDYRTTHSQDVAEVEDRAVEVFCSVIVRLSEANFKPIFLKLLDWATGSSAPHTRSITFYHLASCVAERLKGLFLLFAGHLLKSATKLLGKNHSDKLMLAGSSFLEDEEQACELLSYLLRCLRLCFLHDNKTFLTRERFHSLLQPLVHQVSNQCGGEVRSRLRVEKELAPCLGAFALAAGKEAHWKALNQQLLLTTRHSSSQVRLAGVKVLGEVCGKLGEEFMVLLPETLPFLSELMEDESEEVERATHELVKSLEATLGEDIQQYF